MAESEQLVSVEVRALMLDPSSNLPIVILHDQQSDRFLPIWIGLFEAQAIAMALEQLAPPRPMTHDLLMSIVSGVEARVRRIVISELLESTFHAEIHLVDRDGRRSQLDARPSDAIALALRAGAEILVTSEVMESALSGEQVEKLGSEDEIRKWLEEAGPEDFGKYEM